MAESPWVKALELDASRSVAEGSRQAVCDAVAHGADLRVYTEWPYEEHVMTGPAGQHSEYAGVFNEVIDFRETYALLDESGEAVHCAGITTLRHGMVPVTGFNPGPRMSFFMYDPDGLQGVANLLLDDTPYDAPGNTQQIPTPPDMPKMSPFQANDVGSLAPSNAGFVYEFDRFRYWVRDDWQLALAHDAEGRIEAGSWDELFAAHQAGRDVKVGMVGLCDELDNNGDAGGDAAASPLPHVVYSLAGSSWTHEPTKLVEAQTHPLVRLRPAVPLRYESDCWDVAWVFMRSTGEARVRRLDPYTRRFEEHWTRFGCRWYFR